MVNACLYLYESRHDKTCLWHMRTTKTQISLRSLICVFSIRTRTYTCLIQNFKTLSSLYNWVGSLGYLVGNNRRQVFSQYSYGKKVSATGKKIPYHFNRNFLSHTLLLCLNNCGRSKKYIKHSLTVTSSRLLVSSVTKLLSSSARGDLNEP